MKYLLFILTSLQLSSIAISAELDCGRYHLGYFQYLGKYESTIIYRTADYQIEYDILTGKWMVLKVDWKDECNYKITYTHTNRKEIKPYIGHNLKVKIVDGDGDGYDYEARNSADGELYTGRIIFLNWELTAKDKLKIEKRLAKCTNRK